MQGPVRPITDHFGGFSQQKTHKFSKHVTLQQRSSPITKKQRETGSINFDSVYQQTVELLVLMKRNFFVIYAWISRPEQDEWCNFLRCTSFL